MTAETVIAVAKNEVGYLEKATNAMLEEKTANHGRNNFTKYGLARGCNGQPWCDAFVDWCFIKAYGGSAQGLLCGFSNYTPTSASFFKQKGLWSKYRPQPGDVIFFKNSSRICHTGIVYKVDDNKVYTIEGNTTGGSTLESNGGCVAMKAYSLTYGNIAGYGRPNYSGTKTPVLRKGCIGPAVGILQNALNRSGISGRLNPDNDFGSLTYNALVEFQALKGLPKTGVADEKTWSKLKL